MYNFKYSLCANYKFVFQFLKPFRGNFWGIMSATEATTINKNALFIIFVC